jgi:hypothetical protein
MRIDDAARHALVLVFQDCFKLGARSQTLITCGFSLLLVIRYKHSRLNTLHYSTLLTMSGFAVLLSATLLALAALGAPSNAGEPGLSRLQITRRVNTGGEPLKLVEADKARIDHLKKQATAHAHGASFPHHKAAHFSKHESGHHSRSVSSFAATNNVVRSLDGAWFRLVSLTLTSGIVHGFSKGRLTGTIYSPRRVSHSCISPFRRHYLTHWAS